MIFRPLSGQAQLEKRTFDVRQQTQCDAFSPERHPHHVDRPGFAGFTFQYRLANGDAPTAEDRSGDSWNSRRGRIYGIYSTTNLVDGDWEELDDSVEGDGEITSFTDPGVSLDDKKRFYRVVELE